MKLPLKSPRAFIKQVHFTAVRVNKNSQNRTWLYICKENIPKPAKTAEKSSV
jgi:hypothetical protein